MAQDDNIVKPSTEDSVKDKTDKTILNNLEIIRKIQQKNDSLREEWRSNKNKPVVAPEDTISSEADAMRQIAKNTHQHWWSDNWNLFGIASTLLAILALIVAWWSYDYTKKTYDAQIQTEENTGKLTLDQQHNLLVDLVRHLYRNLVVSYGLKVKMDNLKYAYYPSEEHLQKMKVNLNDIHLELFYRKEEQHKKMNELYLMLRNYNLEIDVFCEHFKSKSIDDETKKRDLGTLVHKCQLLTKEIVERMGIIWSPDELENYKQEIKADLVANQNKNIGDSSRYFSDSFDPYNNPESYYATLFGDEAAAFFDRLEKNVRKECGTNNSGQEILHMIKIA